MKSAEFRVPSAELKDRPQGRGGVSTNSGIERFRHATYSSWLQAKTAVAPQGAGLLP
ncbi:hypothetical protein [Nostoc sp.]|uniref:hypothetical protein n=1 Tax=Nostoc sp. TaxID=1180 RepID=UPI002FFA5EAF